MAGSLAMLLLIGSQWFVPQTVAWARMIVMYARHDSLSVALSKTFDGQHPCALCQQIRQGQQEEQQKGGPSPTERSGKMPELLAEVSSRPVAVVPLVVAAARISSPDFYSEFIESPPTPPPRASANVL